MKGITSILLVVFLVLDPFIFNMSERAWASDNPMADAVAFIFFVPLAIFVVGVGLAAIQTGVMSIAGEERIKRKEYISYEGWIMASVTNLADALPGDYVYIENEGPLYKKPVPPGDNVVWLAKNIKCEVLERRIITDNSWFYRSFDGVWFKIKTQEIER